MRLRMANRSKVLRASRSILVTVTTSPGASLWSSGETALGGLVALRHFAEHLARPGFAAATCAASLLNARCEGLTAPAHTIVL